MTHTYSHTSIALLSTRAKKCFSLHGELRRRQTVVMVGLGVAQTTGEQPATQTQSLHLSLLLLVYMRSCRNNSSHEALIKRADESVHNSSCFYFDYQ